MTRVDFYILPQADIRQRHLFACRLAEKAFKLGNKIYIHSDDNAQANALDQLLWSFRDSSFVPHQIVPADAGTNRGEAVQIGYASTIDSTSVDSAAGANGLLINLSQGIPEFFSRFERVSEIVVQHPQIQQATRANYRFYRDRGYQLQTHDLREPAPGPGN